MSHNTVVCNAACWVYLDNMLNGRPADASGCCAECRLNMGQWFSTVDNNAADQKSNPTNVTITHHVLQDDRWVRQPDHAEQPRIPDEQQNHTVQHIVERQNHAEPQKISVQYAGPVEFVAGNKKLVSYYSQITNAYTVLHRGNWVHIPEERVKQQYSSVAPCVTLE
jgi:hypothetical protein